jgi:hypothetical protein
VRDDSAAPPDENVAEPFWAFEPHEDYEWHHYGHRQRDQPGRTRPEEPERFARLEWNGAHGCIMRCTVVRRLSSVCVGNSSGPHSSYMSPGTRVRKSLSSVFICRIKRGAA